MRPRAHLLLISLLTTALCRSDVWALGAAAFGDELVSARSIGQGQVGTAGQSEDPAVVYLNPGAMTALAGTQITAGVAGVDLNGKFRRDGGVESKTVDGHGAVPNFAITQRLLDDRLAFGFAVEAPYGFKSHWPQDGPLRYTATDAKLYMLDLSPAVAYQLCPTISAGVGADFFDAHDVLQAHQIPNPDSSDGEAKLSAKGTSWGMHVGVRIAPNEHHTVGLVYHSKVKLTVRGTAELNDLGPTLASIMGGSHYATAAYTDLFIPQNVQLGYAFRPDERWTIEADTAWYDWDSNHDVNVRFAETDPVRLSVLNAGNPAALDRRSSWTAGIGANYRASDIWQFRGGVGYLPHATPESTFQPAVNDLTRLGICVGAGWQFVAHWTLDVAYSAIFARSRHITDPSNPSIDGDYNNFIHVLAATITLRFSSWRRA